MTSERIKEIQKATSYPDSISVKQALFQVWNECEQERLKNCSIPVVVRQSEQLPSKEDVASELENHLDKWYKSHSKIANDGYALGFRHCFHYISDWIKQH